MATPHIKDWGFFLPDVVRSEEDEIAFVTDMFEEFDTCRFYGITIPVLRAFILDVKEGMEHKSTDIATRFYHTWIHAMDVMHGCYFFLTCCGGKDLFTEEECVALLTAALGHDYGTARD
jgi:hypothetical protein